MPGSLFSGQKQWDTVADEKEKEDKEVKAKENDSNVYSDLEEYLTQKMRNDLPDESIGPAKPEEGDKVFNEYPENVDPGVVIDWILENRSK